MKIDKIILNRISIANNLPFTLIAGPCQIETLDHALFIADAIYNITNKLNIPFIYKSSFDKANRSSNHASRGPGMDKGLEILLKVKSSIGCPILTDVHTEHQCKPVGEVVDILQIPAFLCRQTDLIRSAAQTGKIIKVKKGQFLAPWDMQNIYDKLSSFNAQGIILTERGTSFGYNTLISDMRGLSIMAETGAPIFFDATHSVQQPGIKGVQSGGQSKYVSLLARCAIAARVAGLFMEVHQDPENAPSDGLCMLHLKDLERTLLCLKQFDAIAKNPNYQ